jgi:hypothetical protein
MVVTAPKHIAFEVRMWHGGTAPHIRNRDTTWRATVSNFKL